MSTSISLLKGANLLIKTNTIESFIDNDNVAWIVLNNTKSNENILSADLLHDFHSVLVELDKAIHSQKAKIVLFVSAKEHFVTGYDLESIYQVTDAQIAANMSRRWQRLFDRVNAIRIPTVCVINGDCLDGGFELALSCMYRVSSVGKLHLGMPCIKLGLCSGAGASLRLPQLIGLSKSLKLLLTGDAIDVGKAKTLGLIDCTFDVTKGRDLFLENVKQWSVGLLNVKRKPPVHRSMRFRLLNDNAVGRWIVYRYYHQKLKKMTDWKYPAPYYCLASVMDSFSETANGCLEFEGGAFGKMATSPECKNLLSIHFMEMKAKSLPSSLSRVNTKPITTVGILGAGSIGSGLALVSISADLKVELNDNSDALRRASANMSILSKKLVKKDVFTAYEMERKMKTLITGSGAIQTCDFVIEAVSESKDAKIQLLKQYDYLIQHGTFYASTTSAVSITELQTHSKKPENVAGIHFFRAPYKTNVVEIIKGKKTSDSTLASIYKYVVALGKIPVVVNDGPGFCLNRLLFAFQCEALRLLKEGATVSGLDTLFESFGFQSGPFRMLDEIGLTLAVQFGSLMKGHGDRFLPFQELDVLVKKGMTGKKAGVGFYIYKKEDNKKKERVSSEISALIGKPSERKLFSEDIIDRCMLLMVNEASYLLHDIVATPDDIDLVLVEGIGFAPFRGGILAYADNRGIRNIVSKLKALAITHGKRFEPSPLLERMGKENSRFFPQRPSAIPYVERRGCPLVMIEGTIKSRL